MVVEIDSLNKTEIFSQTINWIKETYKNRDEVIKTTIDTEKLMVEGAYPNMFSYRSVYEFPVDVFYTIEISFKDGKYKFEPVEVKSKFQTDGCYQPGQFFSVNLLDGSEYYKSNGKLKCSNNLPEALSELLNSLNENLRVYLSELSDDSDDW